MIKVHMLVNEVEKYRKGEGSSGMNSKIARR